MVGWFRGTLALALLTASVGIGALPAQAAPPPLQPGDIANSNVAQCTLGFAFTQGTRVFFSIAGHCVNKGTVMSSEDHYQFGAVVYKETSGNADIALIEVKTAFKPYVRGEVKGIPGEPQGYARSTDTLIAQPLVTSGYGMGFALDARTREDRIGSTLSDNTVSYCADLPSWWGDSGAPILYEGDRIPGTAYGLVVENGALCGGTVTGITVEGILAWTHYRGYNLTLMSA